MEIATELDLKRCIETRLESHSHTFDLNTHFYLEFCQILIR